PAGLAGVQEDPDCLAKRDWSRERVVNPDGSVDIIRTGWFRPGTVVTPTQYAYANTEFYGARTAASASATRTLPFRPHLPGAFAVTDEVRIELLYGTSCHPVELTAEGPGALTVVSPARPNCADPNRPELYALDT